MMKYSTHLLTLFTLGLCVWGILDKEQLATLQLDVIGFSVLITLHEWEEMHWPGGFMELMASMIGWELSGLRPGAEHTAQALFIAELVALPLLLPNVHWLFCGCMILGIFEGLIHVAGIKMAHAEKPYTPGMATGVAMLLYCVLVIVNVYRSTAISVADWGIGFAYFLIWFIAMQQLVISFCRFERGKFMKAMLGAMKKQSSK